MENLVYNLQQYINIELDSVVASKLGDEFDVSEELL